MTDPTIQAAPVTAQPAIPPKLRLWPGVAIFLVLAAIRGWGSVAAINPTGFMVGFFLGPVVCAVALVLWWLFASKLNWTDRLLIPGTLVVVVAALMVKWTVVPSNYDFGVMGLILFGIPIVAAVWIGGLVVTMSVPWNVRRVGLMSMFVALGVVCGLLRMEGTDGAFNPKLSWIWTPLAEEKLEAYLKTAPKAEVQPAEQSVETPAAEELTSEPDDWPEFRGPLRDGRLAGVSIGTNWEQSPPREVWRHPIGPGWSSVTIIGDRLFTQEQRGDDEYVVCYDATKGTEIWSYHDNVRFFETIAGAGPRGTPTFHAGKLYAQGATGKLNCLNAATGKLIWTHDIVADTGAKIPMWGFSSSPLIVNGLVSVFAGGPNGKSVVAYHADSGKLAWAAGTGEMSYCSTQLSKVCGVEQLLITTDQGLSSFNPTSGEVLWHHAWPTEGIARVVQPAVISDTDVLIGTGLGIGTRRVHVDLKDKTWSTTEVWTVRAFKPYYNDFVVLDNHAYGFDGNIFMCVKLEDGRPVWRARGYGNGEVLLLNDQKLLVVMTETGDIVLVEAQPEKHQEIAKFKAIEGKTWNHPVIAHGKLFARNAEEIACFELPLKKTADTAMVQR